MTQINIICHFISLDLHFSGWPVHRVLLGHKGRVTCLLYPHDEYRRYDKEFLVSGGADFSVKLWDIFTGDLLYTFSTHGGELLRLICTPPDCSVRFLSNSLFLFSFCFCFLFFPLLPRLLFTHKIIAAFLLFSFFRIASSPASVL